MKKLLLTFFSIASLATTTSAQHCVSSNNSVNPGTQPAGFTPTPENLPCTILNTPVVDTVYFKIPNTFTVQGSTVTVQYVRIDSLNNLPPGLCWTTNMSNNTFNARTTAALVFSGTPAGPVGQYKLRIKITANIGVLLTDINGDLVDIKYWIRTRCVSAACTPLDTAAPYNTYIAYTACSTTPPPTATISPSGTVSLCNGTQQLLTASSGTGYTYRWSTGATSQSITVNTGGAYRVTVYNAAGDSAVSAPTTVSYHSCPPTAAISPSGTVTLCNGTTQVLTATSGTGYTYSWSTGATSQSITVNTGGAYRVTVYNAAGDSAVSAATTVSYHSCPPTATISPSGTVTLCNGTTQVLTATSGTGYTYRWSTGATTQTITVSTAGSYRVTVYLLPDSAVSAATIVAYQACLPTATISPAGGVTICQGSSQTLTASSGTGYSYRWSTGSASQSISVTAAGSYRVTVYAGADSAVSQATVVSVVTPVAVSVSPSGTANICQGDSATLTASPAGLTYAWNNTATTQSIRVSNSGSYLVTATDFNNCTAVSNIVNVLANTPATPTITRVGTVLTASAGAAYQWYRDGNLLAGETNATLNLTSSGNYTVAVTDANGCTATSAATSVVNVGIADISYGAALHLYPNPGTGVFTLQSSSSIGDRYEIYDALGRTIAAKAITSDKMVIDMSAQQQGIYLLTVKHGQSSEAIRFSLVR